MKICGIAMVKDEADVLELTARHLIAEGVDRLLIAENLSTDDTRELLERLSTELPLAMVEDRDPAYRQSQKMTALANQAAASGAEWIVPFDADEVWRAKRGSLRDAIESTDADLLVGEVFDYYPRPTLRQGDITERMRWSRGNGWCKVAFRWQPGTVIAMGNHDITSVECRHERGRLVVAHYPFRSWGQYRRKMRQGTRALELANTPAHFVGHWRRSGAMSDWSSPAYAELCIGGGTPIHQAVPKA